MSPALEAGLLPERLSFSASGAPDAAALWPEVRRLHAALRQVGACVAALRRDSAGCSADPDAHARLLTCCDEFDDALRDIREEARILEDKLGLRPGEAPWDPGVANPDPRATMGLIGRWLLREVDDLDALALLLVARAADQPAARPASAAVAVAQAGITAAAAEVVAALTAIEGLLADAGQ